jgi:hypothetical protein
MECGVISNQALQNYAKVGLFQRVGRISSIFVSTLYYVEESCWNPSCCGGISSLSRLWLQQAVEMFTHSCRVRLLQENFYERDKKKAR